MGQSTHQDLMKNSDLQHILCDKTGLRRIFFHEKSDLGCMFLIKKFFLIILGCIWCEVLSNNWLVVRMIQKKRLKEALLLT